MLIKHYECEILATVTVPTCMSPSTVQGNHISSTRLIADYFPCTMFEQTW